MKMRFCLRAAFMAVCCLGLTFWNVAGASDWEEDTPKTKAAPAETAAAPLQGRIEHTNTHTSGTSVLDRGPAPVVPSIPKKGSLQQGQGTADTLNKPLDGKAIDDELRGMIQDGSLRPLQGLSGDLPEGTVLKGTATKGGLGSVDPDEEDQELMVEWDRWRNRFLRAVQLGVQEQVNNPDPEDYQRPRFDPQTGKLMPRFPLGTGAAFDCQITSDGRILNLTIIEPSGFSAYDRAVIKSIRQLEGTRILRFPSASRRTTVTQAGRIKTATSSDFQYHHFGDVEKVKQ